MGLRENILVINKTNIPCVLGPHSLNYGYRDIYNEGWIRHDSTLTFRPPTDEELSQLRAHLTKSTSLVGSMDKTACGKVGTDPEVFAVGADGKLIPAFTFLPSKAQASSGVAPTHVYWDGFQGEFTVLPNVCIASMVDSIHTRLKSLHRTLVAKHPGARLVGHSVLPVPKDVLLDAPTEHVQLGCSPSKNAYGDSGEGVPNGRYLPIRFAGCHIHLGNRYGAQNETDESYSRQVKMIDAIAGVISVSLLEGLEHEARRHFYGLAGEYRTPSHGLEYRVLSSTILWHPALFNLMTGFVRIAQAFYWNGWAGLWDASEIEVRESINTLDTDQARTILRRNRSLVEKMLWRMFHDGNNAYLPDQYPTNVPPPEVMFDKIIMPGAKQYIELDMEKNWYLNHGEWILHSESPGVMFWRASKEWLGYE